MATHLKITDFPTFSVIAPRTDQLTEIYRMEGFFDAQSIERDLLTLFTQSHYWPSGRALPRTLPSHALAYPGLACTPAGRKRLGFGE